MDQKESYATISLTNYPGPNTIMLKILEKIPLSYLTGLETVLFIGRRSFEVFLTIISFHKNKVIDS